MKEYVLGFAFTNQAVLLIKKTHPEWQKDSYNGLGGEIKTGETPHSAMCREFHEECGIEVPGTDWNYFAVFTGSDYRVYCFTCRLSGKQAASTTKERVGWFEPHDLPTPLVTHVNWLVPMAHTSTNQRFCYFAEGAIRVSALQDMGGLTKSLDAPTHPEKAVLVTPVTLMQTMGDAPANVLANLCVKSFTNANPIGTEILIGEPKECELSIERKHTLKGRHGQEVTCSVREPHDHITISVHNSPGDCDEIHLTRKTWDELNAFIVNEKPKKDDPSFCLKGDILIPRSSVIALVTHISTLAESIQRTGDTIYVFGRGIVKQNGNGGQDSIRVDGVQEPYSTALAALMFAFQNPIPSGRQLFLAEQEQLRDMFPNGARAESVRFPRSGRLFEAGEGKQLHIRVHPKWVVIDEED